MIENLGSAQLVTLHGGAGFVQVVVDEEVFLKAGDKGYAIPRTDRVLLYRDGDLIDAGGDAAAKDAAGREEGAAA